MSGNTTRAKQMTKLSRNPFDELNIQIDKLLDVRRIGPGRKRPADHDEENLVGATIHEPGSTTSSATTKMILRGGGNANHRKQPPHRVALQSDPPPSLPETNHERNAGGNCHST
ncbi:hypothetical protein R1flu_022362 [Riccia fluitans]|uniref:Uncharacterized protein n=1 Tax=Riccia fluitans TaxID=41844 RepID=A0ABD1ZUW2_9MARC